MKIILPRSARIILLTLGVAATLSLLSYGGFRYRELRQENILLGEEIVGLHQDLAIAEDKNNALAEALRAEQNKNSGFEVKIGELSGIVGNLQKLSILDPELLQKYSKVYFLRILV